MAEPSLPAEVCERPPRRLGGRKGPYDRADCGLVSRGAKWNHPISAAVETRGACECSKGPCCGVQP